ncbi:MAG: hypothetical protein ACOC44_09295 [Promethearchaeia archaeon]
MEDLENIPALIYSILWQTKAMGFFKRILKDLKIDSLKILIYFNDYPPGSLIELNGKEGDFKISQISDYEDMDYDGAIIGDLKYVINLINANHPILRALWNIITRQRGVKLKGLWSLLKFGRVLLKCAI